MSIFIIPFIIHTECFVFSPKVKLRYLTNRDNEVLKVLNTLKGDEACAFLQKHVFTVGQAREWLGVTPERTNPLTVCAWVQPVYLAAGAEGYKSIELRKIDRQNRDEKMIPGNWVQVDCLVLAKIVKLSGPFASTYDAVKEVWKGDIFVPCTCSDIWVFAARGSDEKSLCK